MGRSRSHDAVIRVYDKAGNVIETHEHKGDFEEPSARFFAGILPQGPLKLMVKVQERY
jgi:hypothetical protein